MIEVSEGRTGIYFVYGVGVVLISFILIGFGWLNSFFILLFGISLFVLSILMFLASNGLEIKNGKYRNYSNVGGVKIGKWHHFSTPESVLLRMHAENSSKEFGVMVGGYVPSMNTKVISYDIILIDEQQRKIQIYEFLDYKVAKKTLQFISEVYTIPWVNKVAEKLQENKLKRRGRARRR